MNTRHIRRAVALVARSAVAELHVENGAGLRLIVRNRPCAAVAAYVCALAPGQALDVGAVVPAQAAQAPGRTIRSPMVGTFYQGLRRGGEPLVRPGERVEAGQAVASIEMMRLMYAVRSDCAGVVEKVLVQDGEPVEYGQSLLCIA